MAAEGGDRAGYSCKVANDSSWCRLKLAVSKDFPVSVGGSPDRSGRRPGVSGGEVGSTHHLTPSLKWREDDCSGG